MIDDIRIGLAEWTARHNRWSDAEVDEQGVVDGVGNEDAGYADHRELGELAAELPEPLVGHLGMMASPPDPGHGRPA